MKPILHLSRYSRLPNEDVSKFRNEGYCVVRSVIPMPEIQQARAALDDTIRCRPGERWERLTEPHVSNPFWLELCRHPRIIDVVSRVLGDDLVLLMSHLIVKQPTDGLAVEWHQDRPYWPSVEGTDIVTVWLALDETDSDNGCMHVIPRSQEGHIARPTVATDGSDLLGVRIELDEESRKQALPIELMAGDLSVHDAHVIHGSPINQSTRRRAGYTMRFGNTLTTRIDVAKHWVPVWLVKGQNPPWNGWRDLRSDDVL